ncbi:MAG TPA: PP2C family serine/threonine-protein phosphatase [Acidimicrobiia bacterium]|nr:PP2C family serine/threonine-protein phosphatase [Acidimicrobiia bacterium]
MRSNNEDSVYPPVSGAGDDASLFIVADGMGGHVAGEVASRIAVETATDIKGAPGRRVTGANHALLLEVAEHPELAGMGTTMTILEISGGVARLAHVGDSRAYLLRDSELRQLTVDHTVAAEYVAAGRISPEEAQTHPQRNMITRALGLTQNLLVDEIEEPVEPGDRFLLCSDGVNSMLTDQEIRDQLTADTPEEAVWALVEAANAAGGHDNISAVVVDVVE